MTRIALRPLCAAVALTTTLGAQMASAIAIVENDDPFGLANALLLPDSGSDNLILTGATLTYGVPFLDDGGSVDDVPPSSLRSGIFTNSSGTYGLPLSGGIVLSTGSVLDYQDGPNTVEELTTEFGEIATPEQQNILEPITGQLQHHDPVELNITFHAEIATTVTFFGVFGSEEWPEFVGGDVTDGFGLLVNGVNVAGTLPPGGEAGDPLLPINIDHPDFADIRGTELDGVLAPNGNPLLRFDVPVVEGDNNFQIILADAGDSAVDSTIFLSSLGELGASEFTPILPDPSNPTNADGDFLFELPEIEAERIVWIDPEIATGYVYTAVGDSSKFASVQAPNLAVVNDADGYIVEFLVGGVLHEVSLAPGGLFDFTDLVAEGVDTFTIRGIDPALGLDPNSPVAFALGVSFTTTGFHTVTQDPITIFVPDDNQVPVPGSLALFGLGLAGLAYRRKILSK